VAQHSRQAGDRQPGDRQPGHRRAGDRSHSRQAPGRRLLSPGSRPVALAAVAACVIVVAALGAWVAHRTQATSVDRPIDAWLTSHLGHDSGFVVTTRALGNPRWVTGGCVAAVLACLVTRRYRGALLVAIAVPLAGAITEFALKPLFDRTITGFLAFPSGHVTGVSALAVPIVIVLIGPARPPWPAALRVLLAAVTLLALVSVALSVVAGHWHYFTDTIGGAAVGIATALLTALALDGLSLRLARRRPAAPDSSARGGITETAGGLPRA
jgi:membrane-associated phospholipid phosphatase